MSVYEALMGVGSWQLTLAADTPQHIRQRIVPFSSVLILPADGPDLGDSAMLAAARYHGLVRKPGPQFTVGGAGLPLLWGDEDGKGRIETTVGTIGPGSLSNWVDRYVSPFTRGTVTDPTGNTVGFSSDAFFGFDTRKNFGVVCQFYGVEWRISPSMVLDVGPSATLFNPPRKALAVRRGLDGFDPSFWGLASDMQLDQDYDDYASSTAVKTATGLSAWKQHSAGSVFYGPYGGLMNHQRVDDGSNVPDSGRDTVAQSLANVYGSPDGQRAVKVSTSAYDVRGLVAPGDPVLVFDPTRGLIDPTASASFRGQQVRPVTVRCMGVRWNIAEGMGVWLRVHNGTSATYTKLTPWVAWEEAGAEFEVGALSRTL